MSMSEFKTRWLIISGLGFFASILLSVFTMMKSENSLSWFFSGVDIGLWWMLLYAVMKDKT